MADQNDPTAPTTTTPAAPAQEPAKALAAAPKPEAPTAPQEAKKAPRAIAEDDEPGAEEETVQLSSAQLKRRLDRAGTAERKRLLAEFGVEDMGEAKKKLEKLVKLEEQEEKRKREALSEKERLEQDIAKERGRADEAERRYRESVELHNFEREDTRVQRIAQRFIDDDYIDHELTVFARHIAKNLSPEEVQGMKDKDIAKYFEKRVSSKPKLGRDPGSPPPPAPKAPLSSGSPPERPAPAANGAKTGSAKPYAPGNGMSSAEVKSKTGYRW